MGYVSPSASVEYEIVLVPGGAWPPGRPFLSLMVPRFLRSWCSRLKNRLFPAKPTPYHWPDFTNQKAPLGIWLETEHAAKLHGEPAGVDPAAQRL